MRLIEFLGLPDMEEKVSKHGGRREGSGRKPRLEDGRTITVYLPNLHVNWLERNGAGQRSTTLRALIDADITAHKRYHKKSAL
jgi:hypothetical protein